MAWENIYVNCSYQGKIKECVAEKFCVHFCLFTSLQDNRYLLRLGGNWAALGQLSPLLNRQTVSRVTYALLFLCLSGIRLLLLLPFLLLLFAAITPGFVFLLLVLFLLLLLLLGVFLRFLLHHFESAVEELFFQEPEKGGKRPSGTVSVESMMTQRSTLDMKRPWCLCWKQLITKVASGCIWPVTVIHHRLSGGEQRLLSLFGLGPLRVQQTFDGLGGCCSDAEMSINNVDVREIIILEFPITGVKLDTVLINRKVLKHSQHSPQKR